MKQGAHCHRSLQSEKRDGSKICSGTVTEIGLARWHSATYQVFQKHSELEFQENEGIRMAQCQNIHDINGTVPIKSLWIAGFKSFANFNYCVSFGRFKLSKVKKKGVMDQKEDDNMVKAQKGARNLSSLQASHFLLG